MSADHAVCLNAVRNMVATFNNFLTEAEKMKNPIGDAVLVGKLRETDGILRRILSKWDESSEVPGHGDHTERSANKRAGSSEKELRPYGISPAQTATNKRPKENLKDRNALKDDEEIARSTARKCAVQEKRLSREASVEDRERIISKILQFIKSDVDDGEDKDVAQLATSESRKETSRTDDEILNRKDSNSVSENSLRRRDRRCDSTDSRHSSSDITSSQNEYFVDDVQKISDDVYKCLLCNITLPFNNISSHVKGKAHRNKKLNNSFASKAQNFSTDDFEDFNTSQSIRKVSGYYCEVCDVSLNSECTMRQHILGSKHVQKNELKNTFA